MSSPLSPPDSTRAAKQAFGALGAAMLGLVALTALFYARLRPAIGHSGRLTGEIFILLLVLAMAAAYAAGNKLLSRHATAAPPWWVAAGGALLALVSAWAIPPFNSRDIFGYINRGWQQVHYHANPYAVTIAELPGWRHDPMLTDHWIHNPSPYGFLYMQLTQALCHLGLDQFGLTLLLFKSVNVLVVLGIGAMVYDVARRRWPEHATRSLYLFAWSPLILLQTLAMAHNDILMAGCLALAAYLTLTRRWMWVLPALTAGCLMKYAAGVAVPFALILIWRQAGLRTLLASLGLSIALILLAGWPYLAAGPPIALARIAENASLSTNSLHAMLEDLFQVYARQNPFWAPYQADFNRGLKRIFWAAYGGVWLASLVTYLRGARDPDTDGAAFIRVATLLLALLVGVVSAKFFGWYAVMVFPMAFFLPPGDLLRRVLLTVSVSSLLGLTFLGDAHIINYPLMVAFPVAWLLYRARAARRRAASAPAAIDA